MPRSPRWLASQDRWEEALQMLALLHANGDESSLEVLAEMQEIRERVQYVLSAINTTRGSDMLMR